MAYDTWEAARLISWSNKQAGIKPLTETELIEWVDNGVGLLEWSDAWEEDGEEVKYIDFPTLVSLRMICLLRSYGLSFEELRRAALLSREKLEFNWPFASQSVWTLSSGKNQKNVIWLEDDAMDRVLNAMLIHGASEDLEFDADGVACAWLPAEDIKMDPRFVSGSSCLAGTRIPTGIIIGMVKAGDSIAELAESYDVAEERISNAVMWENQLADAVG